MTFSFGASTQPAAGGFGAAAASTGFGASTTPAPAFGAAASQPSTAFGGFGKTTTTAAGGFGGFGAAATTKPATGFGGFGAAATTQSTGFGGFGATTATTATSAFGGFGGAATTSAAPAFGGFGATTAATGFGGFGSTTTQQTGFGGFGATTTTTSSTGFGGFGGGGGFGAGTGGAFGGGAATGFSNFGATNTQQQQQQQQPPQQQGGGGHDALYQSVMQCSLYNDTRDSIIARLNMLQASWGQGKAYFSNQAQPVAISPDNPLCRFKAVGYSVIPKHDNTDGLVAIVIAKKAAEVEAGKAALVSSLTQVLGNKPGLSVSVEAVKEAGDHSEAIVTVTEAAGGHTRKIPSQDLTNFFTGQAAQLKNLGVQNVYAKVTLHSSPASIVL